MNAKSQIEHGHGTTPGPPTRSYFVERKGGVYRGVQRGRARGLGGRSRVAQGYSRVPSRLCRADLQPRMFSDGTGGSINRMRVRARYRPDLSVNVSRDARRLDVRYPNSDLRTCVLHVMTAFCIRNCMVKYKFDARDARGAGNFLFRAKSLSDSRRGAKSMYSPQSIAAIPGILGRKSCCACVDRDDCVTQTSRWPIFTDESGAIMRLRCTSSRCSTSSGM